MSFFRRNLIDIAIFTLVQYFFTTLVLMYLYEGGNALNAQTASYVFDLNYLSDLGRVVFYNGMDNPFWLFYSLSMLLIGVGVVFYFYLTGFLINHKLVRKLILFLGILSGLGYAAIGFFPVDVSFANHIKAGMLAYYGFILAQLLLTFFINKDQYRVIFYLLVFLNILLLLRFVLYYLIKDMDISAISLLQIKTIYQKILVYGQVFVVLGILIRIKKRRIKLHSYS